MKKSVAIITFHSWINGNLNYGATLQAYALTEVVSRLGHPVELIDYIPENVPAGNPLKEVYRRLFRYFLSRRIPSAKRRGYAGFLRRHGRLGPVCYRSFQALEAKPPQAEIYLVGSDQVWNTDIFHGALYPAFFLGFGSPQKRVAYASSFGSHEVDPVHRERIAELLAAFDSIAVREASGQELVHELLGKAAPAVETVLDPTLLLEDYAPVIEPMETDGMLLAYLFYPGEDELRCLRETAAAMGLQPALIADAPRPEFAGVRTVCCNSPAQWLGALHGAAGVVTNSFHGTVFSTLFEKPFVSLLGQASGIANRNTRSQNLAALLGITDHLTVERSSSLWKKLLEQQPDWPKVRDKLALARRHSMNYLTQALEISAGEKG